MKKVKYVYNPHKLHFEKVTFSFKRAALRVLGFLSSSLVIGVGLFFVVDYFVESPREKRLLRDIEQYESQISSMNREIDQFSAALSELEDKDNKVYRAVYGVAPRITNPNKGGSDQLGDLRRLSGNEKLNMLGEKLTNLRNRVGMQKQSFEDLILLAQNKTAMLACIPAIQPISNKDIRMVASGFGYRLDPIYRTTKFHSGIDFTAPIGREIHATGDGIVGESGYDGGGYGIKVVINHGFGYQTLYGHMSRCVVRPGQKVKRGDVIGYVGSTGKSTGSHVHYEVIRNGEKINPIHYFYNDLSTSDYEKLIQQADRDGQSFD